MQKLPFAIMLLLFFLSVVPYMPVGEEGTITGYATASEQNPPPVPDPWLNGFMYRKPITVSNTGSALSNYQLAMTMDTESIVGQTSSYYRLPITLSSSETVTNYQVKLTISDSTILGRMKADRGDIRFFSRQVSNPYSDTTGKLSYWIESAGSPLVVWVEVDEIQAGTNTKKIHMYYGNSGASSESNGDATFEFFDQFSDLSKWQVNNGVTIDSGNAYFTNGDYIETTSFKGASGYEWKWEISYSSGCGNHRLNLQNIKLDDGTGYYMGEDIRCDFTSEHRVTRSTPYGSGVFYGVSYPQNSNWHTLKLQRTNDGTTRMYIDGSSWSGTDNSLSWSDRMRFDYGSFGIDGARLDNFIVRKLITTEPTYTLGSEVAPGNGGNVMAGGCADMRFTDTDGATKLNYYIEYGCETASTKIWVKIPSVPNGNKVIYMYYGNSQVASQSNPDNTFDFYDDFSDSSLNTGKWSLFTNVGDGAATFRDGVIRQYASGGTYSIQSQNSFSGNFVVERRFKVGHKAEAGNTNRNRFNNNGLNTVDIGLFDDGANTNIQYFWNGWSGTAKRLNTFMILEQIIQSSGAYSFTVKRDDNTNEYSNSATGTITSGILIRSEIGDAGSTGQGGDLFTDWIRVRRYASTLPTISLGSQEQFPVTRVGSATSWTWTRPSVGQSISAGSGSSAATSWVWKPFSEDNTGVTVPNGGATSWTWYPQ